MVTRKNRYHEPQLNKTRGTTQGGIRYPTLFNVTVDSVVRHWILPTVEDLEVIQDRLVHVVGWSLGVFYVNEGLLGLWDPEWMQGALNVLIGMLHWIGLVVNIDKSKTMTCQMVVI